MRVFALVLSLNSDGPYCFLFPCLGVLAHKLQGHDWTFLWNVLHLGQEQAALGSCCEHLTHFADDAAVGTAEASAASADAVFAVADADCLLHQLFPLVLAMLQLRCHTFPRLCLPAADDSYSTNHDTNIARQSNNVKDFQLQTGKVHPSRSRQSRVLPSTACTVIVGLLAARKPVSANKKVQ